MDILTYLAGGTLLLDGAMGSMLYARGMTRDERSESWNLTHPDVVRSIHRAYFDAGSNLVLTNTFGANGLYHDDAELERIVAAAVENARAAARESGAPQEKFVALDIGPCGKLIDPLGDLPFEKAVEEKGTVSGEPATSEPAPAKKRGRKSSKAAAAPEPAPVPETPPATEAPAVAAEPEPATPAEEKPAAKPRKRTSRKKPAIDLTDEQMARLRKMAPGSRQKLLNTLVHLKVPNAEATAVALIANKVLEILPDNHVNWLAQ